MSLPKFRFRDGRDGPSIKLAPLRICNLRAILVGVFAKGYSSGNIIRKYKALLRGFTVVTVIAVLITALVVAPAMTLKGIGIGLAVVLFLLLLG